MITDLNGYYETYFESLATRLSDIGHTPEAPRFWLNSNIDGLSEIESAVRTKLKLPALLLDNLEFAIPVGDLNVRERATGAFSVLCSYKQGDSKSFLSARNQARLICNKILYYMIRDANPNEQSIPNPDSIYRRGIRFYQDVEGDFTRSVNEVATGFFYEFQWEIPVDLTYGMTDFATLS